MDRANHRKLSYEELRARSHSIESIRKSPRFPVYVILENIRSLQNVGSIFRTADGLRITQLIITGYTGRPPRKEIEKAALGAVDSVPWVSYKSSQEAISELKQNDISIVALEQAVDSVDFQTFQYTFPTAVVIGNEYDGIEQETLDLCDHCVNIPMFGVKQSLNVGTALGVLGYEMYRQNKLNGNNLQIHIGGNDA
ncbi:RNA methyltransferase [candidate division KSB1 bacterium]|nr:RNA methyltransferase [candidate division KSB1 bacterium]